MNALAGALLAARVRLVTDVVRQRDMFLSGLRAIAWDLIRPLVDEHTCKLITAERNMRRAADHEITRQLDETRRQVAAVQLLDLDLPGAQGVVVVAARIGDRDFVHIVQARSMSMRDWRALCDELEARLGARARIADSGAPRELFKQ